MALSWLHRLLKKKSPPLSRSGRRHTWTLEALEDRTVPTFLPAVTFPVGVNPRAVTVADFNNDGKPDLAVVNTGPFSTFQSSLSVLLGNGNGSFQPAVTTNVLNSGLGQGNGTLRPGRYVVNKGDPHNKLYAAFLNMFGIQASGFGDARYPGVLTGLT